MNGTRSSEDPVFVLRSVDELAKMMRAFCQSRFRRWLHLLRARLIIRDWPLPGGERLQCAGIGASDLFFSPRPCVLGANAYNLTR